MVWYLMMRGVSISIAGVEKKLIVQGVVVSPQYCGKSRPPPLLSVHNTIAAIIIIIVIDLYIPEHIILHTPLHCDGLSVLELHARFSSIAGSAFHLGSELFVYLCYRFDLLCLCCVGGQVSDRRRSGCVKRQWLGCRG